MPRTARATPDPDEIPARRRTARLSLTMIAAFAVAILIWVPSDPGGFARGLGLGAPIPAAGWLAAAGATAGYVAYTLWAVPEIRPLAREVSWFRALAIPIALGSGLIEEMFFRHFLMSLLDAYGMHVVWQVLVSALIFSLVHVIWVLFGRSWRAVVPILVSVFGLGVLMALVYLTAGRVALPAVAAHAAINLVIEPGLLLSSARRAEQRA